MRRTGIHAPYAGHLGCWPPAPAKPVRREVTDVSVLRDYAATVSQPTLPLSLIHI